VLTLGDRGISGVADRGGSASHCPAWACLAPLVATFLLLFMLPMHARERQA
jgi:hypothetical protein